MEQSKIIPLSMAYPGQKVRVVCIMAGRGLRQCLIGMGLNVGEDGTISLEGGFSDGSSGAGVTVLLVENKPYEGELPEGKELYNEKLVLLRTKLDEYGELTLDKPEVPYLIVFDAGPGHVVEKEGPPLTEEEKE